MRVLKFTLVFLFYTGASFAQKDSIPFFKGAIQAAKEKQYQNIINRSITKNLSLPLSDSTEDRWINAFWSIELLQYKAKLVDVSLATAFNSIEKRSAEFQRALLELVYGNYPAEYIKPVLSLLNKTSDDKIFVMCAEYLTKADSTGASEKLISNLLSNSNKFKSKKDSNSLIDLFINKRLPDIKKINTKKLVASITAPGYLAKNVIIYSFQRKNRDYPGLAIVRDTAGNFLRTDSGKIFFVPQLARSKSGLPYYLTNGNTPQGFYRMDGFDISSSSYIGPTKNIQLMMPCETSLQHFFKDSTIVDSVWTIDWYKKIIPSMISNNDQLLESYYASSNGRTEIIAHGTTVDPEYYRGKKYYPQTPTEGCLATKEIWSNVNGKRVESDQQKLVNAIQTAGGADGYCIVIEIDDQQKPVTIDEILNLLK